MTTQRATQTIFKGDTVKIECQGMTLIGEASSVDFDSYRDNYNIEIESQFGYRYWKQGSDGGTVEKV